MNKLITLVIISIFFGAGLACQSQQNDQPPVESPDEAQPETDDEPTIAEDDEKINDRNELGEGGGAEACPEPRQSDDMCAQVIVWALSPDGICCQYPTPCHAPEDWETFQSEEDCEQALPDVDSTE